MKYARDNNGVLEYPKASEFVGIPNWWLHDYQLRKKHYMPMMGEPEDREGYEAVPKTWTTHVSSSVRMEERQENEDVYEEDPVTHERVKTGTRPVMVKKPITVDTSYIQIDTWEYIALPAPDPEPEPVVYYSKYQIQLACQRRGLWEDVKDAIVNAGFQDSWDNIIRISSDNEELKRALPDIKTAFGEKTVEDVLSESVMEYSQLI